MANVTDPGICEWCGRCLPEQQGSGRARKFCGATCRSAARRQRAAGPGQPTSVKRDLTRSSRQSIVDNVPSERSDASPGSDTVAGAEAGRDLVRQLSTGTTGVLEAVGLAQAIARGAEEGLAMTVARARDDGRTWAEIGRALGISRQGAFQRFGRPADPCTGHPVEPAVPDAGDRALILFDDLTAGRWAPVCAQFGAVVAAKLDAPRLAATWAQVIGMAGRYERRGTPLVYQAGDYTVADVPLFFEAGERVGRVSYDRGARVAGLFFLTRAVAGGLPGS
jgi:hypothetical protein